MSEIATSSPSTSLVNAKWDVVISNGIVKSGLGFGAGVLASVLFFRRRAFPVWLGLGFGLGRAYSEGDSIFREAGIREVKA
ncbi:hypothetical protein HPODL_00753 [Ogataea parapolymorpha DL-1]|uniref:MICOS complex subunit MIC10 n=2 Tax=Ogataea TaxID=461281 RepID=W1QH35_OGAPD|nr:hypothetical protein HPODL_00753 [Ogataea parapolymorpha DL-1]XP_018210166.1 uncharacterized protein OGAPODRAFT_49742 [Ogataea polymorpha]KAG7872079.1 hypothetical protein KL916_003417 [Ogataea parapolymorpha]ESX01357.1 hypothetical protein HPODL_00753 [Ogataea parapolymorpha DL-1]KAH3665205.1 hypothetical protein OGATHE_004020 [Ogataea polymorpha]OBA15213.1 hypothetical protein OGAPODRAFT_49742 [Ogataea polymorpha]